MQERSTNGASITEWNMDTRQNRVRTCVRILSANRSLGVNSQVGKRADLGRVLARGLVAAFRVSRQFGGRAFRGLVPWAARPNAEQRTGRSDRAAGGGRSRSLRRARRARDDAASLHAELYRYRSMPR